jgi:sulfate adenylyltransferase large subunit
MEGAAFIHPAVAARPLHVTTAGSVDDGKSTLIGRLLYDAGLLADDQRATLHAGAARRASDRPDFASITDGLTDEREQGITIDVAYRYVDTPGRRLVIADVPGHVQYTRNMVTGASTADAVVILADAQRGATGQTWRHLCVALLLGIPDIVVAVNKMDLVRYAEERFDAIAGAVRRHAAPFGDTRLHFVPVSARDGDNVVHGSTAMPWYRGPSLLESLLSLSAEDGAAYRPFRFAVQYVSRPGNDAPRRAYMGRVASGRVATGDEVTVLPAGRPARIAAIETPAGTATAAVAGQSVSLYLDRDLDVARGDVLARREDAPAVRSTLDATLFWLGQRPHDPARRYVLRHMSRLVRARIADFRAGIDITGPHLTPPPSTMEENDIAVVGLQLQAPLACDTYRENRASGAFILIDEATNETVAAGLIGDSLIQPDV